MVGGEIRAGRGAYIAALPFEPLARTLSPRGVPSTSSNCTTNEPSLEATARRDTMRGGTFAITVTCSPARKPVPETVKRMQRDVQRRPIVHGR